MQDRYVGDIGDYGKFALLRLMEQHGFYLGVNWYNTSPEKKPEDKEANTPKTPEKVGDGRYRIPEKYRLCDEELADKLTEIFDHPSRSINMLESTSILKTGRYVHGLVPRDSEKRLEWHNEAIKALADCDTIFLDPDNGMEVKSAPRGSAKSVKYVLYPELADYLYLSGDKVVILYQHRPRVREAAYLERMKQNFEKHGIRKAMNVVVFPRYTVRDYFIFSRSGQQEQRIQAALDDLREGPFRDMGMCRIL